MAPRPRPSLVRQLADIVSVVEPLLRALGSLGLGSAPVLLPTPVALSLMLAVGLVAAVLAYLPPAK